MPIDSTSALAQELLDLASRTAQKAGDFLRVRPEEFELNQKSSDRDFATHMDHASEKLIISSILAARPDDGIIGEEGAARACGKAVALQAQGMVRCQGFQFHAGRGGQ